MIYSPTTSSRYHMLVYKATETVVWSHTTEWDDFGISHAWPSTQPGPGHYIEENGQRVFVPSGYVPRTTTYRQSTQVGGVTRYKHVFKVKN